MIQELIYILDLLAIALLLWHQQDLFYNWLLEMFVQFLEQSTCIRIVIMKGNIFSDVTVSKSSVHL